MTLNPQDPWTSSFWRTRRLSSRRYFLWGSETIKVHISSIIYAATCWGRHNFAEFWVRAAIGLGNVYSAVTFFIVSSILLLSNVFAALVAGVFVWLTNQKGWGARVASKRALFETNETNFKHQCLVGCLKSFEKTLQVPKKNTEIRFTMFYLIFLVRLPYVWSI